MSRRVMYLGFGFIVLVGLVSTMVILRPSSSLGESSKASVSGFYLDMGASASLGFQPTGIVGHNGHRTNRGYANDVVTAESAKGVTLQLRQIGCPGETVQRILGQLKDACYSLPATQLKVATSFLRAHATSVGLVTLDLGFNNIRPCVAASPFGSSCAAQGIAAVRQYLPVIVDDLKKAAGPRVHFVGLEYADPYLADYLLGSGGVLAANQNLGAMTQMNTALAQVYGAANVPVANVPGPFQSADAAPATMTGGRTVPTNVARACAWTWMCTKPPWGPDDHPNDAGYQVIANTIVTKLPRKW